MKLSKKFIKSIRINYYKKANFVLLKYIKSRVNFIKSQYFENKTNRNAHKVK